MCCTQSSWQLKFFPVERVIVDVGSQILLDAFVEILDLGIALRMGWCCFCSFDVPQSPKLVGQIFSELFAAIGMDFLWRGETVDPVMQDVGGNCCGLFVWNGHDHSDLGEGVGHAQDMFVTAVGFERSKQISMDADVGTVRNW